jgi:hypothetical protein
MGGMNCIYLPFEDFSPLESAKLEFYNGIRQLKTNFEQTFLSSAKSLKCEGHELGKLLQFCREIGGGFDHKPSQSSVFPR